MNLNQGQPMEKFTERLTEAMRGHKLAVVARTARLSRQQLYKLVHADIKGLPNVETIQALAEVLGVRPAWLAFGEGVAREQA